MGHTHSGFASTRKNVIQVDPPPQLNVNVPAPTVVACAPIVSPLSLNTSIKPSAPPMVSPSQPIDDNGNDIPYYERNSYGQPNPYAAIVNQNDVNPYINGYVNPYYANLNDNISLEECTTPKNNDHKKMVFDPNDDKNNDNNLQVVSNDVLSDKQLAEMRVPKHNIVTKIENIYKYKKQLGTGASCRVLLVEHINTSKEYAMKELLRNNHSNHQLFIREIRILNLLKNHSNIVQIYDIYMDTHSYYIVMEHCSGGDLLSKIISSKSQHFSEKDAVEIIKSILKSIQIMHDKHICHRDIKANNIVFDDKNNLKIIDFGQSIIVDVNKIYPFEQVGTTEFVSPEFNRSRSGFEMKKGDIWSVGVMCFLLMCGKSLFGGNSSEEIWNKIYFFDADYLNTQWPNDNDIKLSVECKDFIGKLLNKQVNQRISVQNALKHKWIITDQSDQHLGGPLLRRFKTIVTSNKLQKILADCILSEIDSDEQNIIKEHVKDKNDAISYLIKYHHSNYNSINLNDKSKKNHNKLMQHRVHHIMNTVTLMNIDEFKFDNNDPINSLQLNASLDKDEDEELDYDSDAMSDDGKALNSYLDAMKSVSIDEFRKILKNSKKLYDVDKLIKELDPDNTGSIKFDAISKFMKPVKSHSKLPGLSNDQDPLNK